MIGAVYAVALLVVGLALVVNAVRARRAVAFVRAKADECEAADEKRFLITWSRPFGAAYVNVGIPSRTGPGPFDEWSVGGSIRQVEPEPNLILDYDAEGKVIGAEVLDLERTSFGKVLRLLTPEANGDRVPRGCESHTPVCGHCGRQDELALAPGPLGSKLASWPPGWTWVVDDYGLHVACSVYCAEGLQESAA